MHVESVISALPGWIGYFLLMSLFFNALFGLSPGPTHNPYNLQIITTDTPAAGRLAPTICESVTAPIIVDPVTENWSIRMVMNI